MCQSGRLIVSKFGKSLATSRPVSFRNKNKYNLKKNKIKSKISTIKLKGTAVKKFKLHFKKSKIIWVRIWVSVVATSQPPPTRTLHATGQAPLNFSRGFIKKWYEDGFIFITVSWIVNKKYNFIILHLLTLDSIKLCFHYWQ